MPILCPIEKKDDSVQNLPALVAAGNSSGKFSGPSGGVTYNDGNVGYYGGTTTLYGSLTSDIARALAPPPAPKEIKFLALYGWSWLMFFCTLCWIIPAFFVWYFFKKSIVPDPKKRKEVFTAGVSFLCIIVLIFGFFPYTCFILLPIKKMLNERLHYQQRCQLWDEACAKWSELYYCHRCGIVFNPETNERFSPNQLLDYLHVDDYKLHLNKAVLGNEYPMSEVDSEKRNGTSPLIRKESFERDERGIPFTNMIKNTMKSDGASVCNNCGSKLISGAAFCSSCGKTINSTSAAIASVVYTMPSYPFESTVAASTSGPVYPTGEIKSSFKPKDSIAEEESSAAAVTELKNTFKKSDDLD